MANVTGTAIPWGNKNLIYNKILTEDLKDVRELYPY